MSSVEMQLVCKIIKEGKYKEAVEAGLTVDILQTSEASTVFKQIQAAHDSAATRGSVMGPRVAAAMFPQLNVNDVDTHVSIEHLVDLVRKSKVASIIEEHAARALEHARIDPYQALGMLEEGRVAAARLDGGRNTDVDIKMAFKRFRDRYDFIQAGGSLGRYPWPWKPLQQETGGVQGDEFAVWYGRPKSKKSFILTHLIADAMRHGTERVLVYTKEMVPDDIFMRILSFLARVPYHPVRHAKLEPDDLDKVEAWEEMAEEMASRGMLTILSGKDVPAGNDTPAWLASKIDKYGATTVFIDGLYLLSPPTKKPLKENERVSLISREMRQIGLGLKVPINATMQANRAAAKNKEANLDEIAFSDSLGQDCTLATRVIQDKEGTISLIFGGSREFQLNGFRIHGVPGTDFSFHSLLSESDATKAKEKDVPNEGPSATKSSIGRARKAAEDAEAKSVIAQI